MGTHPIFESDFDCLTEKGVKVRLVAFGRSSTVEQGLMQQMVGGKPRTKITRVWRRPEFDEEELEKQYEDYDGNDDALEIDEKDTKMRLHRARNDLIWTI